MSKITKITKFVIVKRPTSAPKTPPKAAAPRAQPVAPPTRIPAPIPKRVSAAGPALSDAKAVVRKPVPGTSY